MDGFLSITHPLKLATVFHNAYYTISADGRKVPQITLDVPIEEISVVVDDRAKPCSRGRVEPSPKGRREAARRNPPSRAGHFKERCGVRPRQGGSGAGAL